MKKFTLRLEDETSATITTEKKLIEGDFITAKNSDLEEVQGKIVEILVEEQLDDL